MSTKQKREPRTAKPRTLRELRDFAEQLRLLAKDIDERLNVVEKENIETLSVKNTSTCTKGIGNITTYAAAISAAAWTATMYKKLGEPLESDEGSVKDALHRAGEEPRPDTEKPKSRKQSNA